MRDIIKINVARVTPSVDAVMRAQGVPPGTNTNKRTADLTREALSRFKVQAKPAGLVMEISAGEFEAVYHGLGQNAPDTPLDEIYPAAHSFALFAVTLGESVCQEITRLFDATEYALGAALDTAASEATELLATETERYYRDYLLKCNRLGAADGVMQFSPGYCGWHISAQARLFETLKPNEIGISLNESFLMEPLKSVTGVIIAGKRRIFEFDDSFEFCSECRSRSCLERAKTVKGQ